MQIDSLQNLNWGGEISVYLHTKAADWSSPIPFFRSRPGKPNQRKGQNEKFMNFAHFCEFWCFSLGKQARFTLNFCSGMPLRKVHELTFLWFGLPGPFLIFGGCRFTFWRLKLSWGRFIEKGLSPKRVVLWVPASAFAFPEVFCENLFGRREKTPTPKTRFSISGLY